MHILLAAATPFEIQPTADILPGRQGRHQVGTLVTGIGSLATTHSLMRQIDSQRPDLIVQAGIAGSFIPQPAGTVLCIHEELFGDLGVWEGGGFRSIFDLNLAGKDSFPYHNGLLVNPYESLLGLTALQRARGFTVNEISTDPVRMAWQQQNHSPVVESMEGAALHYVCLQEGLPFLQLRAISNLVGVRDKSQWDIPGSIRRLNEELMRLLDGLEGQDEGIFK